MGATVAKLKLQPHQTQVLGNGYQQRPKQRQQQEQKNKPQPLQQNQQQQEIGQKSAPSIKNTVPDAVVPISSPVSFAGHEKEQLATGKPVDGVTGAANSSPSKKEIWTAVTPVSPVVREVKTKGTLDLGSPFSRDTTEGRLRRANITGGFKASSGRVAFLPDGSEDAMRSTSRRYTRRSCCRSIDGEIVIIKRLPRSLCSLGTVPTIAEVGSYSAGLNDTIYDDFEYLIDDDSLEQLIADTKASDDEESVDVIYKRFSSHKRNTIAKPATAVTSRTDSIGAGGVVEGGGGGGRKVNHNDDADASLDKTNGSMKRSVVKPTNPYITSAKLNHARIAGSMSTQRWIYQWLREVVLPEGPGF